tara:strand:- start:787 stop:1131 length:345 start_codon:yes stop_codon:yes gene_type:complete
MKKLFIILFTTFIVLNLIAVFSFVAYSPKDYCSQEKLLIEMYQKVSDEFNLTYNQYMSLSDYKRFKLLKENTESLHIKLAYEMALESALKCNNYTGMTKWDRFLIDVSSGEYFK